MHLRLIHKGCFGANSLFCAALCLYSNLKIGSSAAAIYRSTKFNFSVALNTLFIPLTNMNTLLLIASCVEAAMAAYVLVQPAPNLEEWRHHFVDEKVSVAVLLHATTKQDRSKGELSGRITISAGQR